MAFAIMAVLGLVSLAALGLAVFGLVLVIRARQRDESVVVGAACLVTGLLVMPIPVLLLAGSMVWLRASSAPVPAPVAPATAQVTPPLRPAQTAQPAQTPQP